MNKQIKILLITLGILIILITTFITVDYFRLKNNNKPIFSINFGGQYLDGGTKVYYGLFYKIIDYNKLTGYTGIKVGTWFLSYDNSL